MRAGHHVVDIAAYEASGASPVAALRVTDRALVLHRWQPLKSERAVPALDVENERWISAALAERIVAARLGKLPFNERAISVRDLRDGDDPCGTLLTWRRPVGEAMLRRIEGYVEKNAGVTLRLYGEALTQLRAFEQWPLRRLRIAGAPDANVRLESVRELHVEAHIDLAAAMRCFPNVVALRFAARDAAFDGASFDASRIAALDCSGLAHVRNIRALTALRALRLARIVERPTLAGIDPFVLALDDVPVQSLSALETMHRLEEIELRALWQLRIEDAMGLLLLPRLVRGWADIGGRRKNIEIYRRAQWAHPWPFTYEFDRALSAAETSVS